MPQSSKSARGSVFFPDDGRCGRLGWCVFVWLCLTVLPSPAWSHAVLIESQPVHGAVLHRPPQAATLRFNATLEESVTHVRLVDVHQSQTPLEASGSAAGQVTIDLPPLSPGVYTLVYKVLARDGHVTEGSIRFTIRGD